jgi:predicted esterase
VTVVAADLLLRGQPLAAARGALLLLHGRGSSAEDILALAEALPWEGFAFVAPRAPLGNTWYPYRFLEPLERNQPALDQSLAVVAGALARLAAAGLPASRVILGGFSQGACLAAELAARGGGRYGGLAILSGGLIGPPGPLLGQPRYAGRLDGTPVFAGCSDVDPHIPVERVHETARVLTALGAAVTERIYPGLGHEVTADEIAGLAAMMEAVPARGE